MAEKELVQGRYLESLGENLSYNGLSAWFDQDGVLFPRTSEFLFSYLGTILLLNQSALNELNPHYINPGNWNGWSDIEISPQLIGVLSTKSTFEILGFDIKIVGETGAFEHEVQKAKIERINNLFGLSDEEKQLIRSSYFSNPQDWPGWKGRKLNRQIANNLVRDFFKTPGLHSLIDPDPQAKSVLDKLFKHDLDINYFSTRRGDPRLHDETVTAITSADFPNASGHIYTMAWDEWQGDLAGPLKESTVWKVVKPSLVKNQDEHRHIVIVDDYFQVCEAASKAGLSSILVEAGYNHPGAPEVEIPYRILSGGVYMHKALPGMFRVTNLNELPFAFHLIQEQVLSGNRDPRWAVGTHITDIESITKEYRAIKSSLKTA